MAFANPLAWWALLLVIGAAAALAWHAYRNLSAWPVRRQVLSTLRFATLLLLVLILMRPIARSADLDARDTVVPILVDVSRSMAIEDADGARRIDRARELIARRLLPDLQGQFALDLLSFGETLAPADPAGLNASARRSDLGGALAAIRERYRGRRIAGVVVLSDGGDTGGVLDAMVSSGTLPPVYPIALGSASVGRDREILSVTAAEAVLDGSRLNVAVSAIAHDAGTGPVELRLLENGRPREVRHVRLPPDGGPIREMFQVAPASGAATVYTVEIPTAPGELVPENNRRSVLVQPPARARRVLLVEGAPGFEHSFLQRALAGDRGLDVDSVVRKGENEQGADTYYIQAARGRSGALASGYPSDAASLFSYDAIVLANVGGDQLTTAQLDATREFVSRRGGGLLVLGAQSFLNRGLAGTSVEDTLPVQLNRRMDSAVPAGSTRAANRVALTDSGGDHPVTQLGATLEESRKRWAGLPPLAGAAALGAARPGASILATTTAGGASRPLIAVQRYGEGRSMVFAGEAAWRWRMMLPSSDRSYETFWRQAVRWLALGATDPVTVLPAPAAGPGDEVVIRATVRDPAFEPLPGAEVDVRVSGPDGRLQQLRGAAEPGDADDLALFMAKFVAEQPGVYRVNVVARRGGDAAGSAASSLLVGGADVEMSDPRVNIALLERLAVGTAGRLITATELEGLASVLRTGVPATVLAAHRDLWHNAWSFGLIIALLAGEWLLRRRWGLR